MAILLSAYQLSRSFAARPLFSGLTFTIETGDRIGLIGPNGAGKSTLLRILASQTSPDCGTLSMQRSLRVGLLEQIPHFHDGATLFSCALERAVDPDDRESIGLAHETVSRLGLDVFSDDTPVERLSGGWKKRVALARELVGKPELLLLDEPTNHLDLETILWLEGFLARASFATVTVTHDRFFLQKVSNRIVELDQRHSGGLLSVKGDYSAYLEVRAQKIAAQERREVVLMNTLRRETEWLRQGAKARTTKQQARIQRAGDLQQEVAGLKVRNQNRASRIDFQSAEKNPKKLLEAKSVSKQYDAKQIFSDLDLVITPGTRIGLIGPNGAGKSTLIRVLLGQEQPSSGTVLRSEHLSVAYFDQTRDTLDPSITLAKTLCPVGEYVDYRGTRIHIRSYLDRFLFTQTQMDMPVDRLSGGEQSRILIARLMLTPANLLVLDEPTNDLDIATLNVLEDCLNEFSGAVILVTHDRYFMDQAANRLLAFPRQSGAPLITFADLAQWEDWIRRNEEAKPLNSVQPKVLPDKQKPDLARKRKLSFKDQRELDSMESTIHAAEERLASLAHESALPGNISNSIRLAELTRQMADTQAEIDRLYSRWAELEG